MAVAYKNGNAIYKGEQAALSLMAHEEYGEEIDKIINSLPNLILVSAKNGLKMVSVSKDPIKDFKEQSDSFLLFSTSLISARHIPFKGTRVQVLHDKLTENNIYYYTYLENDIVSTKILVGE